MSGGVPYKRSRPDGTISNMTAVMDSDPVYYTTTIVSDLSNDTGVHGAPAIFSESRIVPIIPDAYNYGVSLESLRVDTKSVPTFIADRDQKSSDPSVLKQEIGIDMVWTGSMFPSYEGTEADPTIMYVGTSPLPYAYNSTGSVVNPNAVSQALGNQAGVQGMETFFRINDPDGVEWQGAPISNCTVALVQRQMEQSLARAFGTFVTSPYKEGLDGWPITFNLAPNDYSVMSIGYAGSSVIPYVLTNPVGPDINVGSQVYLDRFFYGAGSTNIIPPFPVAMDGFYILKNVSTSVPNGGFVVGFEVTLSLPQQKALKEFIASGGLPPNGCTSSFEDMIWTKFHVDIQGTKQNPANPAQINLTPKVQQSHSDILYKLTISRYIGYGDQGFTEVHSSMNIDFTNTFTAGNTMTKGIYFTTSSISVVSYITPANLYLAQYGTQVLANLKSYPRAEQLLTARTLGFSPNAVFQFGSQNQTIAGVVVTPAVLPRTVNRAFVTSLPMTASTRLRWVTQDSYAATRNPAPYSSYYYGYSIQSFLDDVVNPAFERVLKDDPIDKYFVTPTSQGNQPYQCFQALVKDHPEIKTITDLSLSSQLYCRTYFNSANAQYSQLSQIAVYNKLTKYIAGFPVLSPNLETKEMMLFISNGPSNEPEPPKTPISSEGWLYCGVFLFSSVIFDQTYLVGQAVTHDGIVYTCLTPGLCHDQADLTANFTTGFIALSAVTSKNRIQNTYQTPPELATSAPSIQANTLGGDYGHTFTFHLDAYSSGSPWCESRDPLLAYYRNSWGQVNGQSTIPIITNTQNQMDVFSGSYGRKYDEFIQIHANTQFVNLFSGFNVYCSQYVNPSTGVRTAYWYYNFKVTPQMLLTQGANVEGAGQTSDGGTSIQVQYIPYTRTNNARPFTWRFDSSETSRYTHWNPALSIVLEAQVLSMEPQPNSEPVVLRDNDSASDNTSGRTNKILAEAFLERHPSEGPVIYYPQTGTRKISLTSGPVVKTFSYSMLWRNRFTGETVPLLLSNGGSVVAIFKFHAK